MIFRFHSDVVVHRSKVYFNKNNIPFNIKTVYIIYIILRLHGFFFLLNENLGTPEPTC